MNRRSRTDADRVVAPRNAEDAAPRGTRRKEKIVIMFDPDAWRARQPSQFPSWLAKDVGLDPSRIDAILARPNLWNRLRGFLGARRRNTDRVADPRPLPFVRSDAHADREESAAA